jgi:hypothetical protein
MEKWDGEDEEESQDMGSKMFLDTLPEDSTLKTIDEDI